MHLEFRKATHASRAFLAAIPSLPTLSSMTEPRRANAAATAPSSRKLREPSSSKYLLQVVPATSLAVVAGQLELRSLFTFSRIIKEVNDMDGVGTCRNLRGNLTYDAKGRRRGSAKNRNWNQIRKSYRVATNANGSSASIMKGTRMGL